MFLCPLWWHAKFEKHWSRGTIKKHFRVDLFWLFFLLVFCTVLFLFSFTEYSPFRLVFIIVTGGFILLGGLTSLGNTFKDEIIFYRTIDNSNWKTFFFVFSFVCLFVCFLLEYIFSFSLKPLILEARDVFKRRFKLGSSLKYWMNLIQSYQDIISSWDLLFEMLYIFKVNNRDTRTMCEIH